MPLSTPIYNNSSNWWILCDYYKIKLLIINGSDIMQTPSPIISIGTHFSTDKLLIKGIKIQQLLILLLFKYGVIFNNF